MMIVQWISLVFLVSINKEVLSTVNTQGQGSLENVQKRTYPITGITYEFHIVAVSDLESNSMSRVGSNTWQSYLKRGFLTYNTANQSLTVKWDCGLEKGEIYYSNYGNTLKRGFELSAMTTFNKKLIAADDETGIVYVYFHGEFYPWKVVSRQNPENETTTQANSGEKAEENKSSGQQTGPKSEGAKTETTSQEPENKTTQELIRPMNIEWATVKGDKLIVGPDGNGEVQFVAKIDNDKNVEYEDWTSHFRKLRVEAGGISEQGYMTFESCEWSNEHSKYFFLPKRAADTKFDYSKSLFQGTNMLLTASSDFTTVEKKATINREYFSRGYSCFKFLPYSKDEIIIALQTSEITNETHIIAFTITGEVIYEPTKVADIKFEGFNFV